MFCQLYDIGTKLNLSELEIVNIKCIRLYPVKNMYYFSRPTIDLLAWVSICKSLQLYKLRLEIGKWFVERFVDVIGR